MTWVSCWGKGGPLRILANQVRVPDVALIRWEQFPDGTLPKDAIWATSPDLAVEILSPSNTDSEMRRKLR